MPAAYQGTVFRPSGAPIVDLAPPQQITPEEQRARLDLLDKLNRIDLERNPGNSELLRGSNPTNSLIGCRDALPR